MRKALAPMILAYLFAIGGCTGTPNQPIPDGTYVNSSGEEKISVRGPDVHFFIRRGVGGGDEFLDGSYTYSVLPDGEIQPYPMKSGDAILGVGQFIWYWDGKNIVQHDSRSPDSIQTFTRKP